MCSSCYCLKKDKLEKGGRIYLSSAFFELTVGYYLMLQAADECTLVLELDQKHTGALMLRAQTLVTLKEYHSALFDVNRLIELNPSSEVYQNLHARLKTQLVVILPFSWVFFLCLFTFFTNSSLSFVALSMA